MTHLSSEEWSLQSYNICTQHSLCWRGLRAKYEIVESSHIRECAKLYDWRLSPKFVGSEDILTAGRMVTEDDTVFSQLEFNRMKMLPPETDLPTNSEREIAKRMSAQYTSYKKEHELVDFIDMIEIATRERITPRNLKYILVDEAQDLCQLLYSYHKVLYEDNPNAIIRWYGDEDQCAYSFMGADPSIFVNQKAQETIYGEKSWRLSEKSAATANLYISLNKTRLPKKVQGSHKNGDVYHCYSLDEALSELRFTKGHVLWLTSTNAQAARVRDVLREKGLALTPTSDDLMTRNLLEWIATKPRTIKRAHLSLIHNATLGGKKVIPYDKNWWDKPYASSKEHAEYLSGDKDIGLGISREDERLSPKLRFILETGNWGPLFAKDETTLVAAIRLMETTDSVKHIEVTTFHKSKGREADAVVVLKDVSGRMLKSILLDPESGRRVGFVAMTRSRGNLIMYRDNYTKCKDWFTMTM